MKDLKSPDGGNCGKGERENLKAVHHCPRCKKGGPTLIKQRGKRDRRARNIRKIAKRGE